MSFLCPACRNTDSLKINNQIEIFPDRDWDEISLQVVKCPMCGFTGLAVYCESRRGVLDSEAVLHVGYRVPARIVQEVQRAIKKCPHPRMASCSCLSHQRLGIRNAQNQWDPPFFLDPNTQFPVIIGGT